MATAAMIGAIASAGSVAVGAYGLKQSHDAKKDAERDAKDAKARADAAEAKREQDAKLKEANDAASAKKLAESTPFGSMAASSRIAAEKQVLARRGGAGSAAKSRQTNSLG